MNISSATSDAESTSFSTFDESFFILDISSEIFSFVSSSICFLEVSIVFAFLLSLLF